MRVPTYVVIESAAAAQLPTQSYHAALLHAAGPLYQPGLESPKQQHYTHLPQAFCNVTDLMNFQVTWGGGGGMSIVLIRGAQYVCVRVWSLEWVAFYRNPALPENSLVLATGQPHRVYTFLAVPTRCWVCDQPLWDSLTPDAARNHRHLESNQTFAPSSHEEGSCRCPRVLSPALPGSSAHTSSHGTTGPIPCGASV